MGTVASPNFVIALIDLSAGALDTGETVEVVLHGDAYPGDAISVPEIGTTGYYKIETAGGVAALAQGSYEVYVGGTFKSVITHGDTGLQDHIVNVSDPHSVAAAQVAITDSGAYYTGTDAEAALQEVGADMAGKADTANTILTDNSSQSVAADKPKVTNLDADSVDGKDAGNAADNVLLLDSSAEVPLANIPDILTGKDADTVDGKDVGTSAGNIPEMATGAIPGKMSTSLLGKEVGGGLDDIAQISDAGAPPVTRLHTSFLGKRFPVVCARKKAFSSNVNVEDRDIQYGYFVFEGDGTGTAKEYSVTFPTNFATDLPYLVASFAGLDTNASAPEIDDLNETDSDIIVVSVHSITTSGFKIRFQRTANNWLAGKWYGGVWWAIGKN